MCPLRPSMPCIISHARNTKARPSSFIEACDRVLSRGRCGLFVAVCCRMLPCAPLSPTSFLLSFGNTFLIGPTPTRTIASVSSKCDALKRFCKEETIDTSLRTLCHMKYGSIRGTVTAVAFPQTSQCKRILIIIMPPDSLLGRGNRPSLSNSALACGNSLC